MSEKTQIAKMHLPHLKKKIDVRVRRTRDALGDDLLMSDADEFFESIALALSVHGDKSDRVFPVTEFFMHIRDAKQFVDALKSSGKMHENLELAQGHFARGIERRFKELPRGARIPESERAIRAFANAGALISLLNWWVDRGMKETPEEIDTLFHQMVWGDR